jgi:hypothetical protein
MVIATFTELEVRNVRRWMNARHVLLPDDARVAEAIGSLIERRCDDLSGKSQSNYSGYLRHDRKQKMTDCWSSDESIVCGNLVQRFVQPGRCV